MQPNKKISTACRGGLTSYGQQRPCRAPWLRLEMPQRPLTLPRSAEALADCVNPQVSAITINATTLNINTVELTDRLPEGPSRPLEMLYGQSADPGGGMLGA
jgi:hypothetical protein